MALLANELRIGNYIYYRNGSICKVDYHQISYLSITTGKINYKPIPLTEDILIRCGFELVHEKNKHYTINDPNGLKDSHKISVFPTMNEQWHIAFSDTLAGYKDYIPTTKIKYLHQLQNLFFCLCGKELEISL